MNFTNSYATGHALCWHHPALWGLLPEKTHPLPTVPTWPEFLRGCLRYRQSLDEQLPDAPRSDTPYQPLMSFICLLIQQLLVPEWKCLPLLRAGGLKASVLSVGR